MLERVKIRIHSSQRPTPPTRDGKPFATDTEVTSTEEFQFYLHPFAGLVSKTLKKSCTGSTFGIEVTSEDLSKRAYIRNIVPKKSASQLFCSLHATRNRIQNAFIIEIEGHRIFSQQDAITTL